MSDETNQATTPTPDAGAGQPQADATQQPDAGATNPAGQPFAVFPTATAFNERLQRETRKEMDARAKAMGHDTWQAFEQAQQARQAEATPAAPTATEPAPTTPAPGPDEAARLRLAIEIGGDRGLPHALLTRLQGNSREEMEADADRLLGAMQQPRAPGIPGVPRNNQSVTFTRAQLKDPAFVRANATAIQAAAREGRIVDA